MPQRAIDPQVNPADETIGTKGLAVRFLVTGDNSNGSIAAFELMVPAAQRLPAPAHSHDHYEETIYGIEGVLTWTVGKQIEVRGRYSAFRVVLFTGSPTTAARK